MIEEQEIQAVFGILRDRTTTSTGSNETFNQRNRRLMDSIKKGPIDTAHVLRELYQRKKEMLLCFSECYMLNIARSQIAKEVAFSRGQTKEQVTQEIEAILQQK